MRFPLNSDALSVGEEKPREKGFGQPSYTQVPNYLMDQWLPEGTANRSHPQMHHKKNTSSRDNAHTSSQILDREVC